MRRKRHSLGPSWPPTDASVPDLRAPEGRTVAAERVGNRASAALVAWVRVVRWRVASKRRKGGPGR